MKRSLSRLSRRSQLALILISFVAAATLITFVVSASRNTKRADAPQAISTVSKSNRKPLTRIANRRTMTPVAPFFAPTITATLADDITLANKKDPGATITYTAIITAAPGAGNDATGVIYTDILDNNTTLVGGSIKTTPIAFDDSYNVIGNMDIQVPDGVGDLLANDIDPDTGNNTGLTATAQTVSSTNCAACLNVTINADGSFVYNPPVGFQGNDTFTYTVNDATGKTGTGTVTLIVSGIVWFINNNAPACTTLTLASGCGRLTNPFSTLAAFQGFNDGAAGPPAHPKINDNIFIFESGTNYIGPVTLLGGQRLFGQDSPVVLGLQTLTGLTPQAYSDPFPTMNSGNGTFTTITSGSTAIFLNATTTSNNLNGFTVGTSTTTGINGLNFGTLNVGSVILNTGAGQALLLNNGTVSTPANYAGFTSTTSTGGATNVTLTTIAGTVNLGSGALSGAAGNGLNVDGAAAAINFSGTISNTTGRQVSIINKTGGIVALSGAVSGTGTGIFLNSNTGATINFTGGVTLSTSTNAAFTATGGGTISVTGAANDITTTTGVGININGDGIGAGGVAFRNITVSGAAANGIILNNTSGAFAVSGTTNLGTSGGTGPTGVGINVLNYSTGTISFSTIDIERRGNTGILIDNFDGTTGTFGATTIPNQNNAGGYGIRIDNSTANMTFSSATISDPHTLTAQTDGNTDLIPDNDGDGDAIFLKTNTGSFTLSAGTLSNCGNDCIDGRTVQAITLTNVTINTPGQEGGGQGAGGHGISFIDLTGTSNLTGLMIQQFLTSQTDGFRTINTNKNATINVINCRFENSGVAPGNPDGNDGLFFEGRGTSNMTTVVDENSPDATHFSRFQGLFGDGIQISTGNPSSGTMNTTVKNTDFKDAYQGATQTGSGNNGLRIAGVGSGKHAVDIQNNTFLNVNKPLFAQGVISLFINNNSEVKGTIAGNSITNATQAGIQVFADNLAGETITDMDLIIQNNTINNVSSQGILVQMTVAGGTLAGCDFRLLNNNIGQTTPVGTGAVQFGFPGGPNSSAEGILMSARGTPKTCNVKIDSNNVRIDANGVNAAFPPANEVLELDVSENAFMSATVTNNQLLQLDDTTNGAAFFANVFNGGFVGTPTMCLDFRINTGNTNVDFFILEQATNGTISIENMATYQATNTGTFSTAGNLVNSAGCAEPPVGITQLLRPNQPQNGYLAARQNGSTQQSLDVAANHPAVLTTDDPTIVGSNAQPSMLARLKEVLHPVAAFATKLNFLRNSAVPSAPALTSAEKSAMIAEAKGISAPEKPDDQKVTPQVGGTVTVNGSGVGFTLPAGKTITITYDATVNAPPFAKTVSTQGTVSGGNFASVLTDDPEVPPNPPANATVTNINVTSTWVGLTSTDWNDMLNWSPNTYAPGVSNPAVNDVVIPNVGAQPTIGSTDIGIFSLDIANGRTLTIASLRTLTIGGSPGGNLILNGIISGGGFLNLGTGTHAINNAGGTGSIGSTILTTVLSGSTVTLNNDLQMGSLQVNAGGSMNVNGNTLSLNGPGAALTVAGTFTPAARGDGESPGTSPGDGLQAVGGTVVYNGSVAQTGAGIPYSNLTINNPAGVTLTGNASLSVIGVLTLTSGDLNMGNTGQFTLTVPNTLATLPANGTFDVIGSFQRTGVLGSSALTFGNANTQITLTGSTLTSLTVNMTKATPTAAFTGIANSGWPGSIQRTYLITPAGGTFTTATLRLHYLDSELNAGVNPANVEGANTLRLYKYVIASPSTGWQQQDPAGGVTTSDNANNWVQKTGVTSFSPWTIAGQSATATTSTVSGRILDSDGNPVEGAVIRLNGTQDRKTITDANGNYNFAEVETNGFYTVTPSRVNYNFAPAIRGFSALGAHTEASFAGAANGNHLNPLDTTEYFVRQQYVDFLGREPEEKAFNDWTDTINNCAPGDASCDRVHVSEMFFRSEEFQQRGYFVYRFYSTAFGQKPDYTAFAPDLGRVSGFLDATQLEAAKTAFANDFVNRPAFAQYATMTNAQYVDALSQTAGVTLSNRQTLVDSLEAGTLSRAQALRQIADGGEVYARYYNQAFVVMEYFGYLRRDPDSLYLNWISVLDANPADSRHMVEGFVDATEYRNRFKQ